MMPRTSVPGVTCPPIIIMLPSPIKQQLLDIVGGVIIKCQTVQPEAVMCCTNKSLERGDSVKRAPKTREGRAARSARCWEIKQLEARAHFELRDISDQQAVKQPQTCSCCCLLNFRNDVSEATFWTFHTLSWENMDINTIRHGAPLELSGK